MSRSVIRFVGALVGSLLLHLTFGTVYCWGNLAPYVVSYMRELGHDVDYGEMSWAVSVTTAMQAVTMLVGGWLHPRIGLHKTAGLGCCMATLGVFLSSFTIRHGKSLFLLTYAVLFGSGVGFGYVVPMLVLMKWLPSSRGLASGIVVAGFGAGACVFNKLQEEWINPQHMLPLLVVEGHRFFDWHNPDIMTNVLRHVPSLLRVQSAIFIAMQFVGVLLLFEPEPPKAERETLIESLESNPVKGRHAHAKEDEAAQSSQDLTLGEVLRTHRFWVLIGNVFCCAQVVLIMAASQKTFGLDLLPAVSDDTLTNFTGIASLLNGIGRLAWGTIGDLTSYRFAMSASCTLLAVLLATLPFVCVTVWRYGVWLSAIFFCIGGFFSMFPLATSTLFGPKHMGSNYGAVFLGVAVSELIASVLLQCFLSKHPMALTCEVLAALSVCSVALATRLAPPRQEQSEANFAKLTGSNYGGVVTAAKLK